jgi:D-alanine-D-alanine ligase
MNGKDTMKIGLTYDLRSEYRVLGYSEEETAEFDSEETVTAIEKALRERGNATERIGNLFSLVDALAAGRRWDLVFNIAEGLNGFSREAQVPALLEAYGIPCTFSDAHTLALTHHKPTTKRLVGDMGIPTPVCEVVAGEEDVLSCSLSFPVFVKPVAEGTSKGITEKSVVTVRSELPVVISGLLQTYHQPVMIETFLPGREVTVGVVGTGRKAEVVGVLEISYRQDRTRQVYSYHAKEYCERLIDYHMATDSFAAKAADMALHIWTQLGCRDAGRVDFRADATGMPHFLEVNPLPGLHPTHSDLPIMWRLGGRIYEDLIGEIGSSAVYRVTHRKTYPSKADLQLSLPDTDVKSQDTR